MVRVGTMSDFYVVVCNCVKCVCFVLLGALHYGHPMCGCHMPWLVGFPRYWCLSAHRRHWCSFEQEIQGKAKVETEWGGGGL